MSRYRRTDETIAAILTAAQGGASMSKVIREARISYDQFHAYAYELMTLDLLAEDDNCYSATPKGFEWLQLHSRLGELMLADAANPAFPSSPAPRPEGLAPMLKA